MDFVYGPLNQAAVNPVEFVQAGSTVAGPPVTNFIAAHWKINLVYEQILSIKTNLIQISIGPCWISCSTAGSPIYFLTPGTSSSQR